MPSNKSKRNQRPKKKKTNKTPRPPRPAYPASTAFRQQFNTRTSKVPRSHHAFTCSLLDPFCPHARNAHVPDGLSNGTLTLPIRAHSMRSTNAAGGSLLYVCGSLPYSLLGTTSYAAGVYTLNAAYTDMTAGSGFTTWANTYRIVSWGVIIRSVYPAASTQGYVLVSKQTKMLAPGGSVAEGAVYGTDIKTIPMAAGTEIYIVSRPQSIEARNFNSQNTNTTITNDNWEVIKVEMMGGPATATNVFDIEVVYNVEITLTEAQSGMAHFVPPTRPVNNVAIQAAAKASSSMNTIFEGKAEQASNYLAKAASNALDDVLSGAMAFLGI